MKGKKRSMIIDAIKSNITMIQYHENGTTYNNQKQKELVIHYKDGSFLTFNLEMTDEPITISIKNNQK